MAPRVHWREIDKATLITRMRWGKANGFQADSGWKPQIWGYCATDLVGTPGAEKTAAKCKDQFHTIKSKFAEVYAVSHLSGFGWDDGLKMVTATPEVWDRLLAVHPDYARWQTTSFPLYNDMLYLVEGIVATGAGAFHAGAPVASVQSALTTISQQSQSTTTSQSTAASQNSVEGSQNSQSTQPSQFASIPVMPNTPAHQNMTFSSSPATDDLLASSPPPMAQKRAASSSPEKPHGRRHRKPRNAEVGSDIASALRDMAGSLKVVGSPEARARAVQQMEEDDEFSDEESATIMRLFTLDSAVAQTYTASKKKSRRTAYIRDSVEAAQAKGIL